MKKRKAIVDTMMRRLETGRTERMHTKRELQKWSKAKLIREVIKLESILLKIAIRLYKSKLPRLKIPKGEFDPRKGYVVTTRRGKLEHLPMTDPIFKGKYTKKFTVKRKKRKFSRKQLAAQRLFAKRARAGTLKRRRR